MVMRQSVLGLLVVSCLVVVVLSGVAPCALAAAEESPVDTSHLRALGHASEFYFDRTMLDTGETALFPEADVVAYVGERYADGKVLSTSWLDSYNLFRACCHLANRYPAESDQRRHWLTVAVQAASKCFELDPQDAEVCFTISLYVIRDVWFCDELIRLVLAMPSQSNAAKALKYYNVANVLRPKGEFSQGLRLSRAAAQLYPKDSSILHQLRWFQKAQNRTDQAIETTKSLCDVEDAEGSECTELYLSVKCDVELGDLRLARGDRREAYQYYSDAWPKIERMYSVCEGYAWLKVRRNECATGLGVIALAEGDVDSALLWLKRSYDADAPKGFLKYGGYDLRLVKELISKGLAQDECKRYLEAGSSVGQEYQRAAAKRLLESLTTRDDTPN
ncbi:MAG TPA: hypothetical protein VM163_08575 [bacterium]|nr:hypothetical protein [bacterium]